MPFKNVHLKLCTFGKYLTQSRVVHRFKFSLFKGQCAMFGLKPYHIRVKKKLERELLKLRSGWIVSAVVIDNTVFKNTFSSVSDPCLKSL